MYAVYGYSNNVYIILIDHYRYNTSYILVHYLHIRKICSQFVRRFCPGSLVYHRIPLCPVYTVYRHNKQTDQKSILPVEIILEQTRIFQAIFVAVVWTTSR